MPGGDQSERKQNYFIKLKKCLTEYTKCFIVHVDNVTSLQLSQIRKDLREKAVVLMGKNTMIRKGLRELVEELPHLEKLMAQFKGNVGFVFTNDDLKDIREIITSNKVQAPARAGAIAPLDVYVPPGNTGMGPDKTSFFQALAIQTKITKGMVEIINEVHLIKVDEKVGASEATLLQMLKVYPFSYGLKIVKVFDNGALYDTSVLDISMDDIAKMMVEGLLSVASFALAAGYPTAASAPHAFINGFKDVAGLALAADYIFDRIASVKAMLDNPELLAAAAAPAAAVAAGGADTKAAPAAAAPVEEEEESDEDMGMGLFD